MGSWEKDSSWTVEKTIGASAILRGNKKINMVMPPEGLKWTKDKAIRLIKQIQSKAWEAGFALSLGGGVLDNGSSENDLDIVALPAANQRSNTTELLKAFFNIQHSVNSLTLRWKGLLVFKLEGDIDLVIPITKNEVTEFNIAEIQSWGG